MTDDSVVIRSARSESTALTCIDASVLPRFRRSTASSVEAPARAALGDNDI